MRNHDAIQIDFGDAKSLDEPEESDQEQDQPSGEQIMINNIAEL